MSDPAVEAAQRAATAGQLTDDLMIPGLSVRAFGEAAAREMAAPIRDLVDTWTTPVPGSGQPSESKRGVAADFIEELLPLIYTSEELTK